jgi:hypothetical protein
VTRTIPGAIRAWLVTLLRPGSDKSGRVRMRREMCRCCGKYVWIAFGPRKAAAKTFGEFHCLTWSGGSATNQTDWDRSARPGAAL